MGITPLEIRKKDFQKAFRGYEKEEVDAFLLSLSNEWERLQSENREYKKKLENSERELGRLKDVESSLFKTLKNAEDTGANMIDHATKTAELHIREAQIRAEGMLSDAKSKSKDLIEEAEEKAREVIEDMLDEAKGLQKDYSLLLEQRDHLLQEMKNIANDTLDKISKAASRHKKMEDKLKDLKTFSFEKKSEPSTNKDFVSQTIKQPSNNPALNESISQSTGTTKGKNNGSFFDTLE